MIERKTCLLLGAGASQHLGFPLGYELKQKILHRLRTLRQRGSESLPEKLRVNESQLQDFYDSLAYGDWQSPDAFLEKHSDHLALGKYLICDVLSERENEDTLVDQMGWYARLVSALAVKTLDDLALNNLSIVTFNYDRSVDFRLHKYVQHQFDVDADTAWQRLSDAIPIIHLHGTLGSYPKFPYGTRDPLEQSRSIKIVHEVGDDLGDFERASKLLHDAERVVVFGFGFGADNVRRLNYFREVQMEERDIMIACGHSRGPAAAGVYKKWLGRWGLQENKHVYFCLCASFFDIVADPFEQDSAARSCGQRSPESSSLRPSQTTPITPLRFDLSVPPQFPPCLRASVVSIQPSSRS